MQISKCSLILIFFITLASCKTGQQAVNYQITKDVQASKAMVVTAHPFATAVGLDILKKGGNAVDAAIAVQFALQVCFPVAGNIGGGGFMVYRKANGEVFALDYREKAPALATKDMYLDENKEIIANLSTFGHLAAGVPGSVDGMWQAFNKFSKLKDWKTLIQPSVDGSINGIFITDNEARSMNNNAPNFLKANNRPTIYGEKKWKTGDLFIQKELGFTLKQIRDHGRDGFYEGKVADLIVKEMQKGGGLISHEDLQNYISEWRTPISFKYRGHDVYSMPPPSSGGIALLQLMKMTETFEVKKADWHKPALTHLMIEAEKRVYADRAKHLGDSDYYPVPIKTMSSDAYIRERMQDFNPERASYFEDVRAGVIKESDQTTHFSIVDDEGNAVSITTTLNGGYGSMVVVEGAGFLLNNEMDDFSSKPGVPNLYGLVGAEANKIEPGKRMLSSMTPTIVSKDGKLKAVVGTPGGSTIITSVYQTLLNIIDFEMSAYESVAAPRFHHQWRPEEVIYEKACFTPEVLKTLGKMGHILKERGAIGRVEAICIDDNGNIFGGADPRGEDDAKGY